MKVLLLSHIFPPAIDGGSKVIYKLGQYFESQHHQTLYLSSNCSSTDDFVKKIQQTSAPENQRTIKLPVYTNFRKPLKFLNLFIKNDLLKVFQKGPIFKLIPFIKATIKIIKFKPDLIVAGPLPTTIVLYANFFKFLSKVLANQRASILINSSFHSTDQDFQQQPLIKSLQKADFLWTLTQSETDYFIKNFNIDRENLILAGNGVDSDFLKKSKHLTSEKLKSEILFIGSLASHKRVDLLIKSFSNLTSEKLKSEISLTIAGQKTLFYPQIEKLINSLDSKIKSKINFIFNFPQKDLSKLIDSCDVLVLPSIQESFGLVVIEAWARQKPVICADIPALKELVEKSNGGLLFKTDNQKDLTKKIQFILDNPKKAKELGQSGYEYVKNNYTWEKVGDKICQKILC
ncbi:MAG: glycosyltransferase family 4 protein [Candidatus Shapirobacteria bacterium]|nr:glycosyltransferase family 4 protein [Candidatus Shapirobacteria bacterium]MDD4410495.1 glycosyltransferase family 4 protein [Candidatus Shapirobacteria bacterium]